MNDSGSEVFPRAAAQRKWAGLIFINLGGQWIWEAVSDLLDNESGAFERPDYLRSRHDRDATRHKPGSYQKSGDVEWQSQLVWWPDYIKQSFRRAAEVGDRLFLRRVIADRTDIWCARHGSPRPTPRAGLGGCQTSEPPAEASDTQPARG